VAKSRGTTPRKADCPCHLSPGVERGRGAGHWCRSPAMTNGAPCRRVRGKVKRFSVTVGYLLRRNFGHNKRAATRNVNLKRGQLNLWVSISRTGKTGYQSGMGPANQRPPTRGVPGQKPQRDAVSRCLPRPLGGSKLLLISTLLIPIS